MLAVQVSETLKAQVGNIAKSSKYILSMFVSQNRIMNR